MIHVVEYIVNNYTWFLCGAVVILLAIIGYYADKTNFGQGKNQKDLNDENDKVNKINNEIQQSNNMNNVNKENIITEQSNDNIVKDEVESIIQENLPQQVQLSENSLQNSQTNVEQYNNVETIVALENNGVDQINNDIANNFNPVENISNNVLGVSVDSTKQVVVGSDNNQIATNEPSESKASKVNNRASKINSIAEEINSITVLPEQYLDSNVEEITKAEEEFSKFDEEFNLFLPKKEIVDTDLLSDIEDLELDRTKKINLSGIPDLDNISLPKIKNLVADEQDIWKF